MLIANLDSKPLIDFVKCVERTIKKPDYVFFWGRGSTLELTCYSHEGHVQLTGIPIEGGEFKAGIGAPEFIATIKKLHEAKMSLTFLRNKVNLEIDNISASYSTIDMTPFAYNSLADSPKDIELNIADIPWLVDSLVKCSDSVDAINKDDLKFRDILLCSNANITYMLRLTEVAACVCATSNIGFTGRWVVPSASAKVAKTFRKQISACFIIRERNLGFRIGNIFVSFPLMDDTYPADGLSLLQLNGALPLIGTDKSGYLFDRDHLTQAIDLVASVLGGQSLIKFEIIGQQGATLPVWRISTIDHKGNSCDEVIANLVSGDLNIEPFWVNGRKIIKALQLYEETVLFYDHASMFVLANNNGNDLTLFSKSSR